MHFEWKGIFQPPLGENLMIKIRLADRRGERLNCWQSLCFIADRIKHHLVFSFFLFCKTHTNTLSNPVI